MSALTSITIRGLTTVAILASLDGCGALSPKKKEKGVASDGADQPLSLSNHSPGIVIGPAELTGKTRAEACFSLIRFGESFTARYLRSAKLQPGTEDKGIAIGVFDSLNDQCDKGTGEIELRVVFLGGVGDDTRTFRNIKDSNGREYVIGETSSAWRLLVRFLVEPDLSNARVIFPLDDMSSFPMALRRIGPTFQAWIEEERHRVNADAK